MKRITLIFIILMSSVASYAINPKRIYSNTPAKMQLGLEVLHIETKDGLSLNVWHLPSSGPSTPIIISQSDAGNMGDWLYLKLAAENFGSIIKAAMGNYDEWDKLIDKMFYEYNDK